MLTSEGKITIQILLSPFWPEYPNIKIKFKSGIFFDNFQTQCVMQFRTICQLRKDEMTGATDNFKI